MGQLICAAAVRRRAGRNLLGGAGSAVLALACRWGMTGFAAPGEGTAEPSRYTPLLFLFSAIFGVLALWLLFQGLRDLLVPSCSETAGSVRSQLTPEELRLPLREQFALVDGDLHSHGRALAGGKVLIGREWVFAKNAGAPVMRLSNVADLSYRQASYGGMALCIRGRNGALLTLEGLSAGEMEQVQNELRMRLSKPAQ